jgi:O-acetyl-ADP-ribose deacetylase (regulator of RNase III)
MPVTYIPGANITDSDADLLVNTVNCVGVMGGGLRSHGRRAGRDLAA